MLQLVETFLTPRYDTVHGRFKHDVKIGEKDELIVNGHKIKCIQASREGRKALPWKDRQLLGWWLTNGLRGTLNKTQIENGTGALDWKMQI